MAPNKGRDSVVQLRDLPQMPPRREMMPPASKGRLTNRKSSSWLGLSWRTLLLCLIFIVLAATRIIVSQVFDDKLNPHQRLVGGLPGGRASNIVMQEMKANVAHERSGLRLVRDIVAFPDEVMLLVETAPNTPMPEKESLRCMFGMEKTGIYTIEWKDDMKTLLAVRCQNPSRPLNESEFATLVFPDTNIQLHTAVQNSSHSSWTPLVYETLTLHDSVLLFAKGLVDSQGRSNNYSKVLHHLHCSFGDSDQGLGSAAAEVKTRVKVISQEVVRCELPPLDVIHQLKGLPVSLYVPKMGTLRTVSYFDVPEGFMAPLSSTEPKDINLREKKKFFVCSCTMIWNQADFLREWIMYHGFLGIEKWFLYDNNSDDDTEDVLASLSDKYKVSRIPWPWIKTQEAGFSHCALRAKADCEWVLFADVDEFVFPSLELHNILTRVSEKGARNSVNSARVYSSESLPKISFPITNSKKPTLEMMSNYVKRHNTTFLRNLIEKMVQKGVRENKKVGEVRLLCHNFGPSNLSAAPDEGVMMGYTCREKKSQRHKSFVLLEAMSDSLLNVVHHFKLADGYREIAVHVRVAVLNHYKYQAWEVFKAKFVRRVATYVVDWRQQTANSRDRAPELGTEAVEPPDWPSRYCEEEDLGLRNFTMTYFRQPQSPNRMLWHLDGRKTQLQLQREREQQQQRQQRQSSLEASE